MVEIKMKRALSLQPYPESITKFALYQYYK